MGKKGDALRAAKMRNTVYTFTREQLEAHDKAVKEAYKDVCMEKVNKYLAEEKQAINAEIEKEWRKREEDFGGPDSQDRFLNTLSYMLSVCSQILVRDFKWTPLPKDHKPHPKMKLVRFGNAVAQEVDKICDDDKIDIRNYCDQVYETCGVKFDWA